MHHRLTPYLAAVAVLTTACLSFLFGLAPAASAAVADGALVRGSQPAVYYVASGRRYAFPNEATFRTWYPDFSGVIWVTDAELAALPLVGNVTSRPGARMVKIQTDPKVYSVGRGGVLRWIKTEAAAACLYGADWNRKVDDVPDTFFTDYRIGAEISDCSGFDPAAETSAARDIAADKKLDVPTGTLPKVGDCAIFPADNPWNTDISGYPVHPNSAAYIASIGAAAALHPDFGEDPTYGIPYDVVSASQPKVTITFDAYGDESDAGPYPIPANAKVEYGSDHHVLVVDSAACELYELYDARKDTAGSGWTAESGAVFDLRSNTLRQDHWTSADAAGLPIFPGLVRYDEVAAGAINHAIRFTASKTQRAFIHPATHFASSSTDAGLPPMGLRLRLKADYDISGFDGQARVILEAMKKYGLILADNGGNWFFQGEKGAAWDDDDLNRLKTVPGSAFEAVDTGPLIE
jgi:hypothetical protein